MSEEVVLRVEAIFNQFKGSCELQMPKDNSATNSMQTGSQKRTWELL
jgi:hypothetical protein